ncbi:MAG: AmmeMemoRadiSam system protein B [Candidatus Nanoarchaeia archaeon]|nr:AmmeMemoRadiSam system protein B [Candidatus Nanoarchaeia archaeon]MDD5588389.1 AmmeMemoRadiSam system protein B [Candidatus Nanoarchaeia archaeon]
MTRIPIVNNQFYPGDLQELEEEIKNCFLSKLGPGKLPGKRTKNIFGVITPHAGYTYSGPCASYSYKELGEAKFPEFYIMLGVNHTAFTGNNIALSLQDWQTPFGLVKNISDMNSIEIKDFLELLNENNIKRDENAHRVEHSLEVQLPFLQFISKDNLQKLRILPITVSDIDFETCRKVGKLFSKLDRRFQLIISSDFTHYGSGYGYTLQDGSAKKVEKIDIQAVELIKKFDTKGFLEYTEDKTICGKYPIALGLEILKNLGCKKAKLLKYYNSGDIFKDYNNFVGYGSMVFE